MPSYAVYIHGLGPSHTRRLSVCFRAARRRRYKILLLRPFCGVSASRQLVRSVVTSRQKYAMRGIELILFLAPDVWYGPFRARAGVSYSGLRSKHQKWLISTRTTFSLKKKKLILLRTLLLLRAFSSLFNIPTPTPAAKQHQMIVFIGRLAGRCRFDDLPSRLETLHCMEQRTLNCCVCVASV